MLSNKRKYSTGEITKQEFIQEMFISHNNLFEYVELLKNVDMKEISITKDGILFTTLEDEIKLSCAKNDKRIAPFEILNFGEYEIGDASFIFKMIKDGDCIVDIGANIGWYSISMAKKFPTSSIYAFEPSPITYRDFLKNLEINNIKSVAAFNNGLGEKKDVVSFFADPNTSVSNSAKNISDVSDPLVFECNIEKLDDIVEESNIIPNFIKCDVEGAELFVFKGAFETLKLHQPIVFSEMLRKWSAKFNYHPNKIIALFHTLGYKCYTKMGLEKLEEINEVTENTVSTNFFFLHPLKHQNIINECCV
jgi:FkbM family methyltransferase